MAVSTFISELPLINCYVHITSHCEVLIPNHLGMDNQKEVSKQRQLGFAVD